ncbi:cytochrome d ubiquinol oxidase subunit I [Nocardia tenerifensis]|uniref:Cytochrome d ubiquinol oxidase subunit I n=1 Tax=Nocardia tenerifensis TaxID=228006 RepID=A0A318K5X3_9NOCA|nr:cytochrome ubiquinol oxidase subunit I [Nocardia tenerifensis]PXX58674.1 cytochrome d ubiquinol oxidase subunit I [Nocardia tenerifensis]
MDVLDLARVQFAGTTSVHWLFVILTLGLVPVVAAMHTWAVCTRDPTRRVALERSTRFWGQLYVINYALGIVTGLVMEFQFGLNWSGLSKFAGNVIGAPLALETLVAFFAESTFLGMWIFGWGRLRARWHAALIWLVALTAYASAYFILVSNGFMQHPVGYEVRDGVAYLTDVAAVMTNPNALLALAHVAVAALLTGGVFIAGVSAYHIAKHTADHAFFTRSLRLGVGMAALASFPVFLIGVKQYPLLRRTQPMKFAVLDGGDEAAELQKQLVAQHGPGNYTPPSWMNIGQYVMLYLGEVVAIVALIAALVVFREWLVRFRVVAILLALAYPMVLAKFVGSLLYGEPGPNEGILYGAMFVMVVALLVYGPRVARWRQGAWLLVAMIPLPFIASIGGWVFRETGRQPWLIYGELTVDQAVSHVSAANLWVSCVGFIAVFVALAITNWTLIARFARRGPDAVQLGAVDPVRPRPDDELVAVL